MESFYPQTTGGFTITHFTNFDQAIPFISLVISFITSSIGMSKWFLCGPFPIIPKDGPLNGLISLPFLGLMMINTMFGVRVLCIESAFFTSYRFQYYSDNSDNVKQDYTKIIKPVFSPEYRILVYIIPCLISFLVNYIRLLLTKANIKSLAKRYPQIMISSCFTPFIFEGCKEKDVNLRVWKLGTIVNAFFIGCLPQFLLLLMDNYRGVTNWDFVSTDLKHEYIYENNDALFKSRYGNTFFAVISCAFFMILICVFFFTNKTLRDDRIYSKCLTILCFPCPSNCCSNLHSQSSQPKTSEPTSNLPENSSTPEELELEGKSGKSETVVNELTDEPILLNELKVAPNQSS